MSAEEGGGGGGGGGQGPRVVECRGHSAVSGSPKAVQT